MNDDLSQDKLYTLFAKAEGGDPSAIAELVRRFEPLLRRECTTHGHINDDLRQDMRLLLVRKLREHLMIQFMLLKGNNDDNNQIPQQTAQKIQWIETVIHHAAARFRRKYLCWEQEAALSLTFVDEETGEEIAATIPDSTAQLDYETVELRIWLQVLPNIEQVILRDLYTNGLTQRETAQHCHISQMQVSRLHRHALETLRRELP